MAEEQVKNRLEQDSIGKLMLELCTQTTLSIMIYNIYTITDTFYVSKGIGSVASGAIGIFSPVLLLVNGVSSTLGTGGASIISRRLGERNPAGGKKVVGCMMWLWVLCSLTITITGLAFLEPLLELLGSTSEIYPYAVEYGRIMLIGTIISTGFSGIMRAEGDIFYSTLQWCCPVMINLLLDPLFIYGFHMGISGAAVATLIAQLFSALNSIYYFFIRKNTPCRVALGDIRWNRQACKEILYIGLPAFLNSLGNSLTGMVGNQILGQVGGTQAIGTYAVISRIQSFLSTPFSGIMQGIQPMLGFDWGRQQRKRVKRTVAYAILGGAVYGGVIAVCVYCGAGGIVKLFSVDSEITSIGKTALQIICFSLVIGGIMPVIQAYFLALGYGKKVLFLSLESIFAIRLPLLLIAWRLDNLDIIWWILVLTEWLIAGLAVYNYKIVRKER